MSEPNRACCACLTVKYDPIEIKVGRMQSRWRCKDCEREFVPQAADAAPTSSLAKIIKEQAEDEGLWFVATTAAEGYLQQELRRLHKICEKYSDGWAYARKLDAELERLRKVALELASEEELHQRMEAEDA